MDEIEGIIEGLNMVTGGKYNLETLKSVRQLLSNKKASLETLFNAGLDHEKNHSRNIVGEQNMSTLPGILCALGFRLSAVDF